MTVYFLNFNQGNYQWAERYRYDEDQPYDVSVFYKLLKISSKGNFKLVEDSLHDELPDGVLDSSGTYIFIGNGYYPDSLDTDVLFNFVRRGNHVFICSEDFSDLFSRRIFDKLQEVENPPAVSDEDDTGDEVLEEVPTTEQFIAPEKTVRSEDTLIHQYINQGSGSSVEMCRLIDFDTLTNYWVSFNQTIEPGDPNESMSVIMWNRFIDRSKIIPESDMNVLIDSIQKIEQGSDTLRLPGMIEITCGRGRVFFCTTPMLFSNYYMIREDHMNFVRSLLRPVVKGKIYWDLENSEYDFQAHPHQFHGIDEGPMSFILSERSLRTAWYLLLAGGLLYLIWGARRKQRYIPILDNMENTSIEYAEVISQMFMNQKHHDHLIRLKMDLFKSFLRERYRFALNKGFEDLHEDFYRELSERSSVSVELIRRLFEDYKTLYHAEGVRTENMLELHEMIEKFYKTCK